MKIFKFAISTLLTLGVVSCSYSNLNLPIQEAVTKNTIFTNNYDSNYKFENYRVNGLINDTLNPDGESKFEFSVQIVSSDNTPISGLNVDFDVLPIKPVSGWRNVNEIAPKYGSNSEKFKEKVSKGEIRLIGTINPNQVKTDANGWAKTIFTSSHIGGNNNEIAQEKIIAKVGNSSIEKIVNIGYTDLVDIPLIEGGLRISGASGRHLKNDHLEVIRQIGEEIKNLNWEYPLTVTAGNLKWGGLYPPHFTHRRGLTFDFRPMSTDGNPTWCNTDGKFASNYDREKTIKLIEIFNKYGAKKIYFNDPETYKFGVSPLSGHHNHLHVSWLSTQDILLH